MSYLTLKEYDKKKYSSLFINPKGFPQFMFRTIYSYLHRYIRWCIFNILNTSSMHTVCFDWFLSGLDGIINLEFCYKHFWHFTKHYYGMSDLGLTLSPFESLGLYSDMFDQNVSYLQKNEDFDQTFLSIGSKLKMWKSLR